MEEQNYEQRFQQFIDKMKNHDFSYLGEVDLEKWKKGINNEYLLRKEIKDIIVLFGKEEAERILKICLDQVEDLSYKNVIYTQIKIMFYPYTRLIKKGNTPLVSEFKLKNHQSIKHGTTDKMF
jgi:hypothetical protein